MQHKLSVVYGGQWGSEGKGQVAAHIAANDEERQILSIRVGGPNAGHTIRGADGKVRKVQQIPVAAFVRQDAEVYIGASGFILPDVLERELGWLAETWGEDFPGQRLLVDPHAVVISSDHMLREAGLTQRISSTGEGVGAASADKLMRQTDILVDTHVSRYESDLHRLFSKYGVGVGNVQWELHQKLKRTRRPAHVVVEGTQGYMLSLNTSGHYPYVTSRDCGPEALMGQIGISFRSFPLVDVVCTMRTFPIRVGGPSGPLPQEISWETLKCSTKGYVTTPETTTVTGKQRRIARWDWQTIRKTLADTCPTGIALTFLDYEFPEVAGCGDWEQLPLAAKDWLRELVARMGKPIQYISTAPDATFEVHPAIWGEK